MRSTAFALVVCALMLSPAVFGQDDQPIPVPEAPLHQFEAFPARTQTSEALASISLAIPNWSYSVVSPIDGHTYTGQIVGANPGTRPAHATVVPTVIVPVRLIFKYNSITSFVFDPTAADPGCLGSGRTAFSLVQGSPLINDATFVFGATNVGTTQYVDAFQRANFWSQVSASGGGTYHTLLGFAPMPLQTVTVPSANSGTPNGTVIRANNQCGTNTGNVNLPGLLGIVDINSFDPIAQSLISKLGISPNSFVIFLFYNAAMSVGNPVNLNNCCVGGYHSAIGSQTYGVSEFEGRNQTFFVNTADTSILSHEIGEWMNDPLGMNFTPAWGHVGQVPTSCQNTYEVGDPLSGTLMPTVKMSNGFTYHLQELAFFSWFYRLIPSQGVNKWYSDHGTFASDAGAVCH